MWSKAFLEQARSDWQMWQIVHKQELPDCHTLHYLQMTCEKLGKAFLIAGETITPQKASTSHLSFKRFLQIASRNHTPVYFDYPVFNELRRPSGANLIKMVDLIQKNFYHLFAEL